MAGTRRRDWVFELAGLIVVAVSAANYALCVPSARLAGAFIVGLAIVAVVVLRRRRVDGVVVAILLGGIALDALYASYTSWNERNPDAYAHVQYARFLLDHRALPSASDCSECHHPPLYYVVAATILAACERSAALDAGVGLQMLSLSLFVTFLASAAVVIDRMVRGRIERTTAMMLVAFWPYGVIHSVRVNNDAVVCALGGLVLVFLARWQQRSERRGLWIACALVVVGLITKASAVALAGVVVAVVGYTAWRSRHRRRAWLPIAILLVACVLLGRRGVVNTATRAGDLTPRTPRFYLTFEPRDFIERPFVIARRWQTGEPTYWNQFLKSSVFGVRNALLFSFRREPEPNPRLVRAMNASVLALSALTALGVLRVSRRHRSTRVFAVCSGAALVVAAVTFHLIAPYSFHADFRFVLAAVAPLAIAFTIGLAPRVRLVAATAFAAVSVALFLPSTWTAAPERSTSTLPGTRSGAKSTGAAPTN